MKFKLIALTAVAAMAFASCSTEDNPVISGEAASVQIKIAEGAENVTRGAAESGHKVTGTADIVLNNGYLFFVQNRIISKSVQIVTDGTGNGDTTVNYDDLKTGVTFDVPESSNRVVMVGNTPSNITIPPVTSDIDDFLKSQIDVLSQYDDKGGISNASVFGEGEIKKVTGQLFQAQAEFTVMPIVARMQVEKFTARDEKSAVPATDETVVKSFRVDGLFVNYFIPQADLTGLTDKSDVITYTWVSNWVPGTEKYYSAPYTGVLYDYNASYGIGTFSAPDYTPNSGYEAWAYNIFTDLVPHLVVRLSDIELEVYDGTAWQDESLGKVQYITVKGFLDDDNAELKSIAKGYAYTVKEIPVKFDYFTDLPEIEDDMSVSVNITMQKWIEKIVTPVLP